LWIHVQLSEEKEVPKKGNFGNTSRFNLYATLFLSNLDSMYSISLRIYDIFTYIYHLICHQKNQPVYLLLVIYQPHGSYWGLSFAADTERKTEVLLVINGAYGHRQTATREHLLSERKKPQKTPPWYLFGTFFLDG